MPDRDVEKMNLSYSVGWNVNWWICYGKPYGGSLEKLELLYDPEIPLQGIYLGKKSLIWKDTCTLEFIAAHFTIAKTGNNPSAHKQMTGLRCEICVSTHTLT